MIFKTFNSDIDSSIYKIGVFNKSFGDIIDKINDRSAEIKNLHENEGFSKSEAKKQVGSIWSYLGKDEHKDALTGEFTAFKELMEETGLGADELANLKTYLGDDLYHELLTFKREDTYENKNYSSDVVDEATLIGNIEEFLTAAKNQIAKACQPQHEVTVKMSQLLTLSDYENVFDAFALGNYVCSRVNGEMVKMRVVSIPIDFENIEQSNVTFSDTLVGNNQVKSMQEQFQKAASLATSFDFVEKQSERNDQKVSSMSKLIDDGLDATKNMIINSENQNVIMDTHGILGRELDLNTNTYMPEQYRLTSKGLIFTDTTWDGIKSAFGKIFYNGSWTYGVIADSIVGRLIAGETLEIGDKDGNVTINNKGITLDGGAITWKTPVKQSAVNGLEDDLKSLNDNIDNNAQNLTNYKKEISAFQTEVDTQLSIAGVTKIDSTYVYSPKIASGYLYITKDGCSVQIDPSQNYDAKNDKVIGIQANNKDVFYIKRNGDGYFKGKVYATDGEFKGKVTATSLEVGKDVTISTNNISGLSTVATSGKYSDLSNTPDLTVYATTSSVDIKLKDYATNGTLDSYLKTNDLNAKLGELNVAYRGDVSTSQETDSTTGLITTTNTYTDLNGVQHSYKTYTYPDAQYVLLNRENKWGSGSTAGDGKNLVKISKDGLLEANNAIIYGTVYATEGEFTGKVTATSGSFAGSLNSATGTITGALKGVTGDFTGKITADSGQIGGWTIKDTWLKTTASMDDKDYVDTGISWSVSGSDKKQYQLTMNGVNIELDNQSLTSKLKVRINSFGNAVNSSSANCVYANVGYVNFISSGNIEFDGANFGITSTGSLRLGKKQLVFHSLLVNISATTMTYYLIAKNIDETMPVSICNGDGEAAQFDIGTVSILPSKSQILVPLSNLPYGDVKSIRLTYSYWEKVS